ncbi:AAA family ATPase [Anaerofustis sp.]|uniref:AAA family ATPase n=1 Tax=Anaerofustis sp. TaxID=1872517 RepID=UPI0025C6E168|nr:AAA family ATPase [Anaerofustis sp.]
MARKFGKKNHVKVDPFNYSLMMLGEPKIGKTTLLYEVAEKLVGEDGYIFAELFREHGADAIEGIVAENIPTWDNWVEFVDDIVENKTEDYPNLRVVFIDTYDQYISLAISRAIELWNRKNPNKRAETLNQAWGFDSGKKVTDLMFEQVDRLESVGVKVWWIGHVKTKEINDIYNDETYQMLTSDQQQNYFNALKKNIHFLCLAYFDREMQKKKTGKKNIVTKEEKIKTTIKDETRKIKFRDDSFVVDSGSRFSNIKETINLDVDEFIEAITNAIKTEINKNGVTVEERKKENDKEEAENLKRIAEAEANAKIEKQLDELKSKIVEYITENKTNMAVVKPILEKCAEYGYKNPMQIIDLETMKAVAAMIEQ